MEDVLNKEGGDAEIKLTQLCLDIIKSYPDCPKFHLEFNKCKIFAGWLIEKVGLKGKFVGDFGLHKNHALVIVNRGAGKSSDLCILINIVRRKVFESFGIQLEIDPTIIK